MQGWRCQQPGELTALGTWACLPGLHPCVACVCAGPCRPARAAGFRTEAWPDPGPFLWVLSLPGVVQRGRQPPQPGRLVVVPRGHAGRGGPDQLWAARPPVGHALGGAGLGSGRNQQEQPQRWETYTHMGGREKGERQLLPGALADGDPALSSGRAGSSWCLVEPPTSENGIMHVSVGVGVAWAVTKDRKVRPRRGGPGSPDSVSR